MAALLVVASCVIDHIIVGGTAHRPMLGGPGTYVSLAARSLGMEVTLVSLVGADFPDEYAVWLSSRGVDIAGLRRLKEERTTRFSIEYGDNERRFFLRSRCRPISAGDLPEVVDADAVHIGPVANDVSQEVFRKIVDTSSKVSLDPQGYLRAFGPGGAISDSKPPGFIFEGVEIFKASEHELALTTGISDPLTACREVLRRGPGIAIATRGVKGAIVLAEKEALDVPACPPRRLVDATGAGDAFIGAFLAEHAMGKSLAWSAAVGSAAASFVVEGYGPSCFGAREDVYARAETAMLGVRRLLGSGIDDLKGAG